MSALPRKRTFGDAKHMSAKGQKRASLSIQSPRRRGAISLGQRFFQLGHANMTADTSAKCHKRTFGRAALTQPACQFERGRSYFIPPLLNVPSRGGANSGGANSTAAGRTRNRNSHSSNLVATSTGRRGRIPNALAAHLSQHLLQLVQLALRKRRWLVKRGQRKRPPKITFGCAL